MPIWLDVIETCGVVGALGVAADQLRRSVSDQRERDADRRVERALELYHDLVVDGETAQAFHRLSVLLRALGSEQHGFATWRVLTNADLEPGGALDPLNSDLQTPFADLYRVLWFFERGETAVRYGLVDEDVLYRTIGFHCWWWNQLLSQVTAPKASAALRTLGPRAAEWAREAGGLDDWISSCLTDFDGGTAAKRPRGPDAKPSPQ